MIAQDFFRVRVLASGNIAAAYGVASMCPHAGKRPARARQRSLLTARTSKMERISLKQNEHRCFHKRLGEICGLAPGAGGASLSPPDGIRCSHQIAFCRAWNQVASG